MNSWKLNGMAGHVTRNAICKGLNITHNEIYRTVKSINTKGEIKTKDGKVYELVLKEKKDE